MDFIVDPFKDSEKYFATQLQQFQFFSKYSRFNAKKGRRETWKETVKRAVDYLRFISENKLDESDYSDIYNGIVNMEVMPSMRLLATAGEAAKAFPQSVYNCSFTGIDSIQSFVDILNISMNGIGVGFSVEKYYTDQLPTIKINDKPWIVNHTVLDSTLGWCDAFFVGLKAWFNGNNIVFDYSLVRPAGSVLKTKGGRASGPKPLEELLEFARKTIQRNEGKKLSSLNVYDVICKLSACVVSGGHRRVAAICLFDDGDQLMLDAKNVDVKSNPHRYNSNNSQVLPDRELTQKEVLSYLMEMDKGNNGEPGIFSRRAAKNTIPTRRAKERFGLNPCGEIFLRSKQFCNLSSVVCRDGDSFEDIERKVRLATIIGTIQSSVTHFNSLSKEWSENCKEERLLGVDLNGHCDCKTLRGSNLNHFKNIAIDTNKHYSRILGINESAAITTVKPSGNSGVLLNVSSGMHPRWSKYYIRNMRVGKTSPLYKVLLVSGVKLSPENGQTEENATSYVASFPAKSPEGSITRHDLTAGDQLRYWKKVKLEWTEHNPSQTVYYSDNEILTIANFIYDNQDILSGISFLPKFNASYQQAPYIEITEREYEKLSAEFPKIDFSLLQQYEDSDLTESAKESACSAGSCDFQL